MNCAQCGNYVPSGDGVGVSGAGYRKRFCSWRHAAIWICDLAQRIVPGEEAAKFQDAGKVLERVK